MVQDTVVIARNILDIAGSYRIKTIAGLWWFMHFHHGQRPPETGAQHRLCTPAGTRQGRHRTAFLL